MNYFKLARTPLFAGTTEEEIKQMLTCLKAVERNDYFGLYSAKTFCVIPKSSLSDEGREAVSELVRKINESGKK